MVRTGYTLYHTPCLSYVLTMLELVWTHRKPRLWLSFVKRIIDELASTSCLQSHALCILIYLEQEMLCGRVLMMMTWSWILSPQCPHIQADDGSRGDTRPLSPRHPNIFLDLEIFLAESEPRLLCCPQSTLQPQVSVCRSVKERIHPPGSGCLQQTGGCLQLLLH